MEEREITCIDPHNLCGRKWDLRATASLKSSLPPKQVAFNGRVLNADYCRLSCQILSTWQFLLENIATILRKQRTRGSTQNKRGYSGIFPSATASCQLRRKESLQWTWTKDSHEYRPLFHRLVPCFMPPPLERAAPRIKQVLRGAGPCWYPS
jgi:hypothetical protein